MINIKLIVNFLKKCNIVDDIENYQIIILHLSSYYINEKSNLSCKTNYF